MADSGSLNNLLRGRAFQVFHRFSYNLLELLHFVHLCCEQVLKASAVTESDLKKTEINRTLSQQIQTKFSFSK